MGWQVYQLPCRRLPRTTQRDEFTPGVRNGLSRFAEPIEPNSSRVVPGSRLLATDRTAARQSGSPPGGGGEALAIGYFPSRFATYSAARSDRLIFPRVFTGSSVTISKSRGTCQSASPARQ
jgi:hypothetical protein